MYYNRKKYIIKNVIIITFILLVAVIATRSIYYKYSEARNVAYSSDSLEIVFHDKEGAKINLTDPSPVTDAIGLSSKAYTLTIKNNLVEPVDYQLVITDNIEKIIDDNCANFQVPKELLKVSVKGLNNKNNIYYLSDLVSGTLVTDTIGALEEKNYSIRIWVANNTSVNIANDLHYHGIIKVLETKDTESEELK